MTLIRLRVANPSDVPGILELLREMSEETAMAKTNFEKVAAKVASLVNAQTVIVADNGERVVGSVGLEKTTWWYGDDAFLADRWTFVTKPARKGTTASRLIRTAKAYAAGVGLPLAMGVWTWTDTERKNLLFRRHFRPIGEMFMTEPAHVL